MRLSNSVIPLALIVLIAVGTAACGSWAGEVNKDAQPVSEPRSRTPFDTKEPQSYSATLVVTTGGTERTTLIEKDGDHLRLDMNVGTERALILLRSDNWYVISPGERIYFESTGKGAPSVEPFVSELTIRLLHRRDLAEFEPLGTENGLSSYRVRVGGSEASETIRSSDCPP